MSEIKTTNSQDDTQVCECSEQCCVTFYSGESCYFCEPAKGMLRDLLSQFDVSFSCVNQIDIDKVDNITEMEHIFALPTIKICGQTLVGLPNEGTLRDAVVVALMNDCFCSR
ncbi:MAG: hypothetical protein RTU30_09610 [Candidatus Thorarchaeota archaeon]